MSAVINGECEVSPVQKNEAYFWFAVSQYYGKLKDKPFAKGLIFYDTKNSNNVKSIYSYFETAVAHLAGDSPYWADAFGLRFWCIFRQAEMENSRASQTELYSRIVDLVSALPF